MGLHVSQTERQFITFTEALNIPVVLTWGAVVSCQMIISCVWALSEHMEIVGQISSFKTTVVIALAHALTLKLWIYVHTFARDAYKVMVDIDKSELEKFEAFDLKLDLIINDDLASFFTAFELTELKSFIKEHESWFAYIQSCKKLDKHDVIEPKNIEHELDPYQF